MKLPDDWVKGIEVVNFYTIHNRYRGEKLQNSVKNLKTVKTEDFFSYPEKEKNIDFWAKKDLKIKYSKNMKFD